MAPLRAGRLAAARSALRALDVIEVPLPANAAELLAELRVDTSLRLPDCCVLLAAQDRRAAVLTFDDRLAREATRLRVIA